MNSHEDALASQGFFYLLLWILPATLASFHVVRNCRKLAEPASLHVTGTFLLWPLYYLGWILWWPGSLRLRLQGKRIEDLALARQVERLQRRKPGSLR